MRPPVTCFMLYLILFQLVTFINAQEQSGSPEELRWSQLGNQVNLLYRQGRYEEAAQLGEEAVKIAEQIFGPDHPNLATSLNNLALVYDTQREYTKAEDFYQRSLAIDEKRLGKDHPHVATSLNNLACLYAVQGAYDKAEPLYQRALAIREKALDPEHLDVAQSLNNLALIFCSKGKTLEAESLLRRALSIREKKLGPDDPAVAKCLYNLAQVCKTEGREEETQFLYSRALAIEEKNPTGSNIERVMYYLNAQAALYMTRGYYDKAEPLYKRILELQEKVLGADHLKVADSLNNLAQVYYHQGDNAQHDFLQKALNGNEAKEKYRAAEFLWKRALAIKEKRLGMGHPEVEQLLSNLAQLDQTQKRYEVTENNADLRDYYRILSRENEP